MNIFSDTSINKRLIERDLAFKTLAKDCGGDNAKTISEFKQQESEKIKSDKLEALKFLTSKMIESGILYYLNLTVEEFNTIAEKGPFFKLGDITSKVSKNSTAAANVAADMAEAWKELEPEKTEEESEGILDSCCLNSDIFSALSPPQSLANVLNAKSRSINLLLIDVSEKIFILGLSKYSSI